MIAASAPSGALRQSTKDRDRQEEKEEKRNGPD